MREEHSGRHRTDAHIRQSTRAQKGWHQSKATEFDRTYDFSRLAALYLETLE